MLYTSHFELDRFCSNPKVSSLFLSDVFSIQKRKSVSVPWVIFQWLKKTITSKEKQVATLYGESFMSFSWLDDALYLSFLSSSSHG